MDKQNKVTFEEIFKQNERRIHYYIHKLNIRDLHQEFYQEGVVAMWNAYETYQPDKGLLATYFNYTIRNRMIDLIRKQTREKEMNQTYSHEHNVLHEDGNYYRQGGNSYSIRKAEENTLHDQAFWQEVKSELSDNQWKWVKLFIIEDMPVKKIAEQEVYLLMLSRVGEER